jgi:hypothetical protein
MKNFPFSVEHRGSLGSHQLSEHQTSSDFEGTSGEGFVLELVARQTTHRFEFAGWKVDHLGCIFHKQSEFE